MAGSLGRFVGRLVWHVGLGDTFEIATRSGAGARYRRSTIVSSSRKSGPQFEPFRTRACALTVIGPPERSRSPSCPDNNRRDRVSAWLSKVINRMGARADVLSRFRREQPSPRSRGFEIARAQIGSGDRSGTRMPHGRIWILRCRVVSTYWQWAGTNGESLRVLYCRPPRSEGFESGRQFETASRRDTEGAPGPLAIARVTFLACQLRNIGWGVCLPRLG